MWGILSVARYILENVLRQRLVTSIYDYRLWARTRTASLQLRKRSNEGGIATQVRLKADPTALHSYRVPVVNSRSAGIWIGASSFLFCSLTAVHVM